MCFLLKNKQTMGKKNADDGLLAPAILMPDEPHGTKFECESDDGKVMSEDEINLLMHTRKPGNMKIFLATHEERTIVEYMEKMSRLHHGINEHMVKIQKEIKNSSTKKHASGLASFG